MVTDEQIEALAREDFPTTWDTMSERRKAEMRDHYARLIEDAKRGLIADPRNIDNSGMSEG